MSNTTLLLLAITVIMLAGIPIAFIMKDFMPRFLEKTSNLEQQENRIYVLHSEVQDIQDRVNGLTQRRNQLSSEQYRIDSECRKMEKLIRELADQPPTFVHEVGDPQSGMQKFAATLTQSKASSSARGSGERSQPVNPIWRYPNIAEIWAHTMEEAKQMVDIAFPFKLGFTKSFSKQSAQVEQLIAEAKKAAAAAESER